MNSRKDKKELFVNKIKSLYPENYKQIIENIQDPKPITFRINTIKTSPPNVINELKEEEFIFDQAPLPNSYVLISGPKRLSETNAFEEGRIYIQGLSSMIPAYKLNPQPGEKVLDMCAAPGSKTSHIAEISGNSVEITAVENNRNRFFILKENLDKQGVKNYNLLLESAQYLDRNHPELLENFDKILLDAPCSNEGLIYLSDAKTLEKWNPKLSKRLSGLQKKLLATGIKLLKPGGMLVYSTCTFSREENEDVVEWARSKFSEIKVEKMERIIPDRLHSGFFYSIILKSA